MTPINPSERVEMIRERLEKEFSPISLEIIDDSHMHAGHASAGGAGHFTVKITAEGFAGKMPLQRHRMVFAALDEMMQSEIHALTIEANSP
ncbi:MAG: BolA/IbaG family iron-sulfur metabolism protein [Gammaproteobacteria bacterium]|nr:BolA/IbaG family iron-sulfur metabolism protein [Gammaproteobacteria bacterium]